MLIALMVLASANAQVVEKGPVTAQPVTVDVMTGRIEQHAQRVLTEYPPGAAVARSVQIDSAWPRDAAEHRQLHGNSVVLLSAVTHIADELPLRRVYIRTKAGAEIDLPKLSSTRRAIDPKSKAYAVFGPYREDSFYLAPIDAVMTEGAVMADFATGRNGFRISENPVDPPQYWKPGMESGGKPEAGAIQVILLREFPGF